MPVQSWGRRYITTAVPTFTGAGDVVSGALAYWDPVFAYSAATIGQNVVKLRESGGNTTQIFTSQSNGQVSTAAITTFKGANNLFVDTLYDQTGNGLDMTQATLANQPPYLLSQVGALPAIVPDGSTFYILRHLSIPSNMTLPISFAGVCKTNAASGTNQFIWSNDTAGSNKCDLLVGSTTFEMGMNDASEVDSTASVNVISAYANVFGAFNVTNGTTFNINGTTNSGTLAGGNTVASGDNIQLLAFASGVRLFNGVFGGIGIWPGSFSAGNASSMVTQLRSNWGF